MPLPDGYQSFHVVNAYEEGGRLIADVTTYEGALDFGVLNPAEIRASIPETPRAPSPTRGPFLCRLALDLATGASTADIHLKAFGEAPAIREDRTGRRHRYTWLSAPGTRGDEPVDNAYYWYHGVAKLDCDAGSIASAWDAGADIYLTAPVFVPRGEAEDDGWVLVWAAKPAENRGELLVLDGADLASGPIARLALPAPLPPASHVAWLGA
jgi:carotenoid cleavage dioxygenase-like enzyme